MKIRKPAVAGGFYPYSKEGALDQLRQLFGYWGIDFNTIGVRSRKRAYGVVVPHAGWQYSGYVAAKVYASIPKVDTVVLFGPNHYGIGSDFAVSDEDIWQTPLGDVRLDKELARAIIDNSRFAERDEWAHSREHSIEVQIPFLQVVLDEFKIVPIAVKHYPPDDAFLGVCQEVGGAVAEAVEGRKVLIVASTDFTHYEPQDVAKEKDGLVMRAIQELDEEEMFKAVRDKNVSMCGYAGVAATIAACRELGAKKAERVAYMTSGDVVGDKSAVVGYGGLRIL
jgi:AmmeMemoRadiSam system protein B